MNSLRLAKKTELHQIATLFTDSFLDYPLFPFMLSHSPNYAKQLFRLNYINTKSYFQQKSCFVGIKDGKIVAAVLLKKSGEKGPRFLQYLLNGGINLAAQIGVKRIIHVLRTLDKMKEACSRHGDHIWYIDSLAVAKGYQGQNLGSTLFQAFLFPYIQQMGGGRVMLVTHTELNKRFYCKNGFEVCSQYPIGSSDSPMPNYSFQQLISPHE